jgi:RNA polymerase sigma-70 factor (ECF subfamily)
MTPADEPSFGDDAVLKKLLSQAQSGDESAIELLFRRLYPYLLLCAREELDSGLRAKVRESDLVQQSCLEAHREFPKLSSNSVDSLVRWMVAILKSNAADLRRRFDAQKRQGIEPEFSLDDSHSSQAENARRNLFELPTTESGNSLDSDTGLDEALQQLPDDYRTVILLRHRDKLSFADIGERTERSADAARMCWTRAIKRLQEILTGSADSDE